MRNYVTLSFDIPDDLSWCARIQVGEHGRVDRFGVEHRRINITGPHLQGMSRFLVFLDLRLDCNQLGIIRFVFL